MTRRAFLTMLGGAGAAGVLGNAFVLEPRWLDVVRHDARGTVSAQGVTLALLADLHLQSVGFLEEEVAEVTRATRPDLIVLAGDSVDERDRLRELERFLSRLPEEPAKYAVLGNWEHWAGVDPDALRAAYARHGVRLLVNESALFERKGRRVHVTGFDDATAGQPRFDALPAATAREGFRLALAHSPVYRPFLPRGSGRYVEGWYGREQPASGPPLYVSRGIGTSVVPARLGARPEVTLLQV